MRRSPSRQTIRWLILGAGVVLIVGLAFSPVGKPPDNVRVMHLSPKLNRFQRELIMSRFYGRMTYRAQSVSLKSNGPKIRAYLLDLSSIEDSRGKVEAFMKASEEIERGQEPTTATVKYKAVDVSEARFRLGWFPWGFTSVDQMLIVSCCDEDVQVEVRVNYGR
jgi:hypothetical protein